MTTPFANKKGPRIYFPRPFLNIKKRIMGFEPPTILFRNLMLLISVRWRTPGIWPASATILYEYPHILTTESVSFALPISFFIFPLSLSIIRAFCQHFFGHLYDENQRAR
jgi:hypothetical protein